MSRIDRGFGAEVKSSELPSIYCWQQGLAVDFGFAGSACEGFDAYLLAHGLFRFCLEIN
jgi:hypothetical protein